MTLSEITNYLEDDWDDNKLTSRDSPAEGYFLHPSDGLLSGDMEAGDALKGVYRPEWTQGQGASSRTSATSSTLQITGSATGDTAGVKTPALATVGSWSFDYQYVTAPDTRDVTYMRFIVQTRANDEYQIGEFLGGSDEWRLTKLDSGGATVLASTSSQQDQDPHSAEATRTSYGGFEAFRDGSSVGTATDTFLPNTPDKLIFENRNEGTIQFDNLVVV